MDIVLRRVDIRKDMPILYDYMCGDDQYLFSSSQHFNNENHFSRWFEEKSITSFHDFRVIETINGMVLGYIHNYDFILNDGHCKITTYIRQDKRNLGFGALATVSFLDYLFSEYPLRKVYSTVYGYNTNSLQANIDFGFKKEGILSEYRYYDGKYYDLIYYSINRQDFYTNYELFLGKKR